MTASAKARRLWVRDHRMQAQTALKKVENQINGFIMAGIWLATVGLTVITVVLMIIGSVIWVIH